MVKNILVLLKNILASVAGWVFIVLLIVSWMGAYSIMPWSSPSAAETYFLEGDDRRTMLVVFLPNHEAITWYTDPSRNVQEGILVDIYGQHGRHIAGPIWNFRRPNSLFNYRWIEEEVEAVQMEMSIKQKYFAGSGEQALPKKGKKTYSVVLFENDRIKFEGMWLNRIDGSQEFTDLLYTLLTSQ